MNIDTHGYTDVWSNDISDVAIHARQLEDTAEEAAWQATLVARAIDSTGALQPEPFSLAQPDGAAGWNSITVKSQ